MQDKKLLGVCGLYCGACHHYRPGLPGGESLLKEVEDMGVDIDGYICEGCRSDKLYMRPGCAECVLRACAEEKQITHCGLCTQFPCRKLKEFQRNGKVHHIDIVDNLKQLSANGAEQWLANQEERWKCRCGTHFSWYDKSCRKCGLRLDSYGSHSK